MSKTLTVPKDLAGSFNRLMKIIPTPFRSDFLIQRTILHYLSMRDEEFVRNGIERTRGIFQEKNKTKLLKSRYRSKRSMTKNSK